MSNQMVKAGAGEIARKEFGADQLARSAETATSTMVAQAAEAVRARYVMALQRPRSIDDARVALLQECERPGFAEDATYAKPVGSEKVGDSFVPKYAEGLSIRFAERAMQIWRNIHVSRIVIVDDNDKRITRVAATDLEANISEEMDVVAEKTVERSYLKKNEQPIRQRLNSYSKLVYILPATEDDVIKKIKAGESKAKRDCILHFIPRDILDECFNAAKRVQSTRDAKDPVAAKNAIVDGFARVGVKPSDLETFLGHGLDTASPAELGKLRGVYATIRDGELTWPEIIATVDGKDDGSGKEDPRTQEVKAKIAAKVNAGKRAQPAKGATTAAPEATDQASGEVSSGREPGASRATTADR